MVLGTSNTSSSRLAMPELRECLEPLEATDAVSLLPVSTPLSEFAFLGVELVEDDMSKVSFFTEVSLSC